MTKIKLNRGDHLNLNHQSRVGQVNHLHHGAGGQIGFEELLSGGHDLSELADVGGVHRGPDDVGEAATRGIDAGLNVANALASLFEHAACAHLLAITVAGDLPRYKDHAFGLIDTHKVVVNRSSYVFQAVGVATGDGHRNSLSQSDEMLADWMMADQRFWSAKAAAANCSGRLPIGS